MENFEKCTVAMLGGPCSQHVTGNTSRQNQPQSAIMINKASLVQVMASCQAGKESLPDMMTSKVSELASLNKLMTSRAASSRKQSNFVNQIYSVFDRMAEWHQSFLCKTKIPCSSV